MELKLKLDFPVDPFAIKLKHGDRCVLLGSCFSNDIGAHFVENGFDVLLNPFGTVFHPEPISRMLYETISENREERILQRNDLCFSWDAGGTVFGTSEHELKDTLKLRREKLLDYLRTSKYLFITLGSAFGYIENELGKVVANCHKVSGNNFSKSLTSTDLLVNSWIKTLNRIRELNPDLQVVFTVSPVRHVKDGLIENNRSKARLFELVSALEHFHHVGYFPSYEILIDELRDYRFYKSDGIHPNDQAVQYVWSRLKQALMSEETQSLCDEVIALRAMENHLSIHSRGSESIQFQQNKSVKIKSFLTLHPEIIWHKKS